MYYAFFWKVGIEIMLCGIIESACFLQEKESKNPE
jgi:hypothetical protein